MSQERKVTHYEKRLSEHGGFAFRPYSTTTKTKDGKEKVNLPTTIHDLITNEIISTDGYNLGDVAKRSLKSWAAETTLMYEAMLINTRTAHYSRLLKAAENDNPNPELVTQLQRRKAVYEEYNVTLCTLLATIKQAQMPRSMHKEDSSINVLYEQPITLENLVHTMTQMMGLRKYEPDFGG